MSEFVDPEAAVRMVADIIVAYVGQNVVSADELPQLVRGVRAALWPELEAEAATAPTRRQHATFADKPANLPSEVDIATSIQPDYLISFEDGKHYISLRRHLMAKHGLTPEAYREKWGLPIDYPMVAPNYAKERSEVALRTGLGRRKQEKS